MRVIEWVSEWVNEWVSEIESESESEGEGEGESKEREREREGKLVQLGNINCNSDQNATVYSILYIYNMLMNWLFFPGETWRRTVFWVLFPWTNFNLSIGK